MDYSLENISPNVLDHVDLHGLSNESIVVKLYQRMVKEGVLVAPKCQKYDYDGITMCRWHFRASHLTTGGMLGVFHTHTRKVD